MSGGEMLRAEQLSVGYGGRDVVRELDLAIPDRRITAIVGANASGKSTLLRALARLLKPTAGTVLLDGRSIASTGTRDVARRLGILPQSPTAPEGLLVEDLVARGRYAHQRLFRQWSRDDAAAVEAALEATATADLRGRHLDELSGGQRQRVWIAMALAQDTELLLLDEPTTYLDIAHQMEILDLLLDLNEERGRTIVMVLHDLNQASRYAHHLIALSNGRVAAAGPPEAVVTEELVLEVFGLRARVMRDPLYGLPLCLPLGRTAAAPAASGDRVPAAGM